MKIWEWRKLIQSSELKPITKLVLYTLSNYMSENGGECFPSIPTIARDCGLKERAVFNHIKMAVDKGLLKKGKKSSKGQKWSTNTYTAINNMHAGAPLHHDAPLHEDALSTCTTMQSTPAPPCILPLQDNSPNNTPIKTKEKDWFELFWEAYGKIGNKQKAIKAFNKKIKEVDYEEIITGLSRYQEWARANTWYNPQHASTWLNNSGWEDEYTIHAEPERQLSKHERAKKALGLI